MTKLDVVSGFLGAGKTTLIKKLLSVCAEDGERVVLIENEFGEVGIDGPALRMAGVEVYEISQGCVCCSLKGDFTAALKDILISLKPDRIIFEPSGIFVLDEIFDIMNNPDIAKSCLLNTVITVVDAENYLLQNERYNCFFENQIERANVLILSKSQLVNASSLQNITKDLAGLNPGAKVIAQSWQALKSVELRSIIDGELTSHPNYKRSRKSGDRHIRLESWGTRIPRRFSDNELTTLLATLNSGQYGIVVRGKGVVLTENGGVSFSYAGNQYVLAKEPGVMEGLVCVIGENLDSEKLRQAFCADYLNF